MKTSVNINEHDKVSSHSDQLIQKKAEENAEQARQKKKLMEERKMLLEQQKRKKNAELAELKKREEERRVKMEEEASKVQNISKVLDYSSRYLWLQDLTLILSPTTFWSDTSL